MVMCLSVGLGIFIIIIYEFFVFLFKKRSARDRNLFLTRQLPRCHNSHAYVKGIPFYNSQLERMWPLVVQRDVQRMGKGTGRSGHRGLILQCARAVKVCGYIFLFGVADEFAVLEKLGLHCKAKHEDSVYFMGSCKGLCCFCHVILYKATFIRMWPPWDDLFLRGNDGFGTRNAAREYLFSSHPFSLLSLQANTEESTRQQNDFFFFSVREEPDLLCPNEDCMLGIQRPPRVMSVKTTVMVTMPELSQGNSAMFSTNYTSCLGPAWEHICYSQAERSQLFFSCLFVYGAIDLMVKERKVVVVRADISAAFRKTLCILESGCRYSEMCRTFVYWGCPWCTCLIWGGQWGPGVWPVTPFLIVWCLEVNIK